MATEAEEKKHLMATTAIVGGGATGGGVLQQMVHGYLDQLQTDPQGTPDLTINLYDKKAQYGFGGPYGVEPPVFRLNQPAGRMSIDAHDPGSFVAWFREWQRGQSIEEVAKARALWDTEQKKGVTDAQFALNHPQEYMLGKHWDENSFLPRAFYGVYLRNEFNKTLDLAKQINTQLGREALKIVDHDASVDSIVRGADGRLVMGGVERGDEFRQPMQTKVDTAVIATGHHKNDFLSEYRDSQDYIDTPMTIDQVKEKLSGITDQSRPIIIAGTSQSMLDGLAALDAVGYKGKIIAMSGTAAEPWPYDPVKEATPRTDYPLKYLTDDAIKNIAESSASSQAAVAAFRDLVVKELYSPEAMAAGPGHVLETLTAREEALRQNCAPCDGLFKLATTMLDEFNGNHTFQERFDLYQKYKAEGRLEVRMGRIKSAAADIPNGFDVLVTNTVTGQDENIRAIKLINSASMLRTPYYVDKATGDVHSPDAVVETALRSGMLAADDATKTLNPAGNYSNGTVEIVGPAHGGAWGIPFTKDAMSDAAEQSLKEAFRKAQLRAEAPAAAVSKPSAAKARQSAPAQPHRR
jgi:uncharacterized NAD(P)/FAD-binding protein YdhS